MKSQSFFSEGFSHPIVVNGNRHRRGVSQSFFSEGFSHLLQHKKLKDRQFVKSLNPFFQKAFLIYETTTTQ